MSYKLRSSIPSPRANIVELTDYIEIECLKKKNASMSFLEILKSLDTSDDYQENERDEDNFLRDNIEEPRIVDALSEVESRYSHCKAKYPFQLVDGKVAFTKVNPNVNLIYIYLLMATRLTMGGKSPEKVFASIDGTVLFEKLCEEIVKSYWGERSSSVLLGTAEGNQFEKKVENLISRLKEGGEFKNLDGLTPTENDGSVDIVVWKPFSDCRCSQVIGFAQCKTGDSWYSELRKLQPSTFVDTWFAESLNLVPINVFMVADVVREYHRKTFMDLLFFDRCRLMDFLPTNVSDALLDEIRIWTTEALKKYRIDPSMLSLSTAASAA
jgi:hypothetical protein